VRGTIALALYLGTFLDWHPKQEKMLLIGHSHAGQLFALLTQMAHSQKRVLELLAPLEEGGMPQGLTLKECLNRVVNIIEQLQKKQIIFVTLGTPSRYQWMPNKNWQLLHLINHRGHDAKAPNLIGLPWTKGGDYVQQLGVHGSDFPETLKVDSRANLQFDLLLGAGRDWRTWQKQLDRRERLHNWGNHLLIDYHDQGKFPNFYRTILGHGQYTKGKFMLFNLTQMVNHLTG
jgi:hypothetical protein